LANPKPNALAEVKKMAKEDFDLDRMLNPSMNRVNRVFGWLI